MILRYSGLTEIKGSLIAVQGVKNPVFDEMVEIYLDNGNIRKGRIIQIEGDKVIIQVFEGTRFISLSNSEVRFTGEPMRLALAPEILGRIFNGAGSPIDGLGNISSKKYN